VKRFYKQAEAVPAEDGFGLALDGKRLRSPAGAVLTLPTRALAEAIAAEWQAQEGEIQPLRMPLMRLASTAIDRVVAQRADVVAEILSYAATDVVCYRAEGPPSLVARQDAHWQPLLDWMRERYDVSLAVTTGLAAPSQPARVGEVLRAVVESYPPLALAALHALTTTGGSIVVGLAAMEGRLDAAGVWAAAQLEEDFQIEQWGEPPEAQRRRRALREDIEASCRFIELLRESPSSELRELWADVELALLRLLGELHGLSEESRDETRDFISYNELGLALETLAASIVWEKLTLTDAQRADIANLAYFMGMPSPQTGVPKPAWHVAVVDANEESFRTASAVLGPIGYRISWTPTFEAVIALSKSDPADGYLISELPDCAADDIAQKVEYSTRPGPAIVGLGKKGRRSVAKPLDPMSLARMIHAAIRDRGR
jgi:chaperone required for assembly of F1-ATPase